MVNVLKERHLPGALAAIFTTKNDRGASWVRTIQGNGEVAQLLHVMFTTKEDVLGIIKVYKKQQHCLKVRIRP